MKQRKRVAEERIDDIIQHAKKAVNYEEPKPELPTLKKWLREAHDHLHDANQILVNIYNILKEIEEGKNESMD